MTDTARPGRLAILIVALLAVAVVVAILMGSRGRGGVTATATSSASSGATTAASQLGGQPSNGSSPVSTSTSASSAAGPASSASGPGTPATSGGDRSLPGLLAMLSVAPESRTGYDRTLFPHWIDADKNGCDTRAEVLIAEAIIKPTVDAGCSLTGGPWLSQYDGLEVTDPGTLDIDHLVPLAEAWDSGAGAWTTDRRRLYANDLGVDWALIAVTGTTNRSKGDQDPAEWLPQLTSFRCTYEGMWLAVKVRWGLAVDALERAALASGIASCSNRMPVVLAP